MLSKDQSVTRLAQSAYFLSGVLVLMGFAGDHALMEALAGIFLGISASIEIWSRPRSQPRPSAKMIVLLGGLVFWMGLSLLPWPIDWAASISPVQAEILADLEGFKPPSLCLSMAPLATWEALARLLAAMLAVELAWTWSSDRRFRSRLLYFIVGMGTLAAGVGLMDQRWHVDLLSAFRPADNFGHPNHWGFFHNRNHFSNYLNLSLLVGFGLFLRNIFPHRGPKREFWTGVFLLPMIILCAIGSIATTSKGGVISLLMGLALFCLFLARNREYRTQLKMVLIILIAAVGLALAYARPTIDRLREWTLRIHPALSEIQAAETEGRWQIWNDVWNMSIQTKGRGIGVGAFRTVYPAFQTIWGHKTITHPENEYLQAWVEWGWFGGLIGVGLLIAVIIRMVRNLIRGCGIRKAAMWSAVGMTLIHAWVDFPFHVTPIAWVLCALLGSLFADRSSQPEPRSSHVRSSSSEATAVPNESRRQPQAASRLVVMGYTFMVATISLDVSGAGFQALFPSDTHLATLEAALRSRQFDLARVLSLRLIPKWPFYWRVHEFAGFAAAGMPGLSREVQRHYRNAQRLAQSNPMISYHVGFLFLSSNPSIARTFLESALVISQDKAALFNRMLAQATRDGESLHALLPLTQLEPVLWINFGGAFSHADHPDISQVWKRVAVERWLRNPKSRLMVGFKLLEWGEATKVLESYRNIPASSDEDRYLLGRSYESLRRFASAREEYLAILCIRNPSVLQAGLPYLANNPSSLTASQWNEFLAALREQIEGSLTFPQKPR